MSTVELVLPKKNKTKRADFLGAEIVINCFQSNRKHKHPAAFKAHAEAFLQVLADETKILARVSRNEDRKDCISPWRLAHIALHWEKWIRPVEEYRSNSHNPFRQLSSLMEHLFETFPTPDFLRRGLDDHAKLAYVYFQVASGINVRKIHRFPLNLTKQQAHLFHTTPYDLPIMEAALRAQALSHGVDERYLPQLLSHNAVQNLKQNGFWLSFFEFLGRQDMLDPQQIQPLCDYLTAHRVVLDRENRPAGEFSFKGRTISSLMERMNAWHRQLERTRLNRHRHWDPVPEIVGLENEKWIIREILSEKELLAEGREMRHCVYSYTDACVARRTSIWTLQEKGPMNPLGKRVATIEISLHGRQFELRQARGKQNEAITKSQAHFLFQWANQNAVRVRNVL